MSRGNSRRRSQDAERDELVVRLLREGKTTSDVASILGVSRAAAAHICIRVRKSFGAPNNDPPPPGRGPHNWKRLVSREHRAELAYCERHLGRAWVAEYLGTGPAMLDDDQHLVVELLQLHAALLCHLHDGHEVIADVRTRLAELDDARLAHTSQASRHP